MAAHEAPRCPRCGANDVERGPLGERWGRAAWRMRCRACGRGWTLVSARRTAIPRYSYATVSLCPRCEDRGRVNRTDPQGIRYMVCPQGHTWKERGTPL